MIKQIDVSTECLTTWRELADIHGISVAYCKAKFRGQYLPIVRRPGWGSPAVIMHIKHVHEVALAFRSGMYEFVQVDAYWWGVRYQQVSETQAEACGLWRLGSAMDFKPEARITWDV